MVSWGYGNSGCLGHGDTSTLLRPSLVIRLVSETIVYLECGAYHTAAVSDKGELWVWGRNDVNQLGISKEGLLQDDIGVAALVPRRVEELEKSAKAVACGEAHTLVLNNHGQVACFGWGQEGQLGVPREELDQNAATREILYLDFPGKITKVAAGALFSVCVNSQGEVYVWGNGELGQLGRKVKRQRTPTLLNSLGGEFIVDIVCGECHVICMAKSGKVYGWGKGLVGDFEDDQLFRPKTEIVCYLPQELEEVEIAQKILLSGNQDDDPAEEYMHE